jgi:malic enzyme
MVPIVYTPRVGDACKAYSHLFRFARGVFVTPENIDRIDRIFESLPYGNVEPIVVTDSEGILGIGDQGAGGMGIPIGKLSLYVAGAGIHPSACLPITPDVGTDNEELLRDPVYLGLRRPRLRGEPYFALVDRFVQAVRRHFPRTLLQWEDFSRQNAFTLLERYRENPTANCEADPADVYRWSDGRAIVATGSPFPDVIVGERRFVVGQGNNAFIFPGVGLGALAVRATEVVDAMFTAAAHSLFELVSEERLRQRCVYPPYSALRDISKQVAVAVGEAAVREGVAPARTHEEIVAAVDARMWAPHYLPYRPAR